MLRLSCALTGPHSPGCDPERASRTRARGGPRDVVIFALAATSDNGTRLLCRVRAGIGPELACRMFEIADFVDECPVDAGRSALAGRWRVDDDATMAVRENVVRQARTRADGPAIACSGLTKDYGQSHGIFDLDLRIDRGETFGFIGPNGAGKTTTIRLLMDLVRPRGGRHSPRGHRRPALPQGCLI